MNLAASSSIKNVPADVDNIVGDLHGRRSHCQRIECLPTSRMRYDVESYLQQTL